MNAATGPGASVYPAILSGLDQSLKIALRAVVVFDGVVVDRVVALVRRRLGHWHQPDAINAQNLPRVRVPIVQVIQIQPVDDALKIAYAVSIAVGKGAHEDLVADCILPPGKIGHDRGRRRRLLGDRMLD